MRRSCSWLFVMVSAGYVATAVADDSSAPQNSSQHQLMKDCMAKQKASESGMPKEQMKKSCRDLAKTERENQKAESSAERGVLPSDK